jgi:RNA polymerase sigma-70 factor (ECF subfamily)
MSETRNTYNHGEDRETLSADEVRVAVRQSIDGDTAAFGNLYRHFVVRIYRYVLLQIRNVMIAEDITEDVFVKAYNSIQSCRGREDTFSAWLYRIAHNCTIDHFRAEKRQQAMQRNLPSGEPVALENNDILAEYNDTLRVISDLPPQYRQLLLLKFVEGMDNTDIARIMNKGVGNIRVLQMRAIRELRKRYDEGIS